MHTSAGKVVATIQYRILTTGSHGNSVMIDNILIDAGLTRRKLESVILLRMVLICICQKVY